MRVISALAGILLVMTMPAIKAQELVRTDTPSGLPVPRFVSLKSGKTNCRTGPSLKHPIKLQYSKKGLPVRVVAETTDHWRKIEDQDGDQCWVHATLLSGITTAITITNTSVLARAEPDTRKRAELTPGVITRVKKCLADYCLVRVENVGGWVHQSALWGYRG